MCGQIRKYVPAMVLPAGLAIQRPGLTWAQQTLLRCRATEVSAKEAVCPRLAGASKLNAPRFALYHRWPCEAHTHASHQSSSRVASPHADACGHLHSTVGKNFLQVSGTPLGGTPLGCPRPPTRTSTICWASPQTSSIPCAPSGRLYHPSPR